MAEELREDDFMIFGTNERLDTGLKFFKPLWSRLVFLRRCFKMAAL